jgi:hypothetical protein
LEVIQGAIAFSRALLGYYRLNGAYDSSAQLVFSRIVGWSGLAKHPVRLIALLKRLLECAIALRGTKQIGTIKPKTRRGREVRFHRSYPTSGCEVYLRPPA